MNIQTCTTEPNQTITASIANDRVYVRLGRDACLFLDTAEAVDLVDAVASVLAEIEGPPVPVPL